MAPARPKIKREAEDRLLDLGIDLVSMDWAGSRNRPVIRLRIERSPMGDPPVTVDDCARVSRALESWLDEHDEIPERYVLEVSSPGIERPLTRPRDWERFVGEPVVVEGFGGACRALLPARGGAVGVGLGAGTDGSTPAWRWCRGGRAAYGYQRSPPPVQMEVSAQC